MSDADKTQEILDALIARSDKLIWATEPQLGTKLRRLDFWTLHPHEGKGHCSTAYEIKVSRADFKRDSALKQREARLYADQFYYVTPPNLVSPDEIPDWAGLQEWNGQRFKTVLHAPKLSKSVPSWDFVSSIFRSAGRIRRDTSIEMSQLRSKLMMTEMKLKHREQASSK
ncbi:hypothetical protein [Halovulum sp. GXIMD14793]